MPFELNAPNSAVTSVSCCATVISHTRIALAQRAVLRIRLIAGLYLQCVRDPTWPSVIGGLHVQYVWTDTTTEQASTPDTR